MNAAQFKSWIVRLAVAVLLVTPNVLAQVEGPNGHFYQVVMERGLLWEEARDKAAATTFNGAHGHLATITSENEDKFIEELRQKAAPAGVAGAWLWIGGSRVSIATTTTRAGGWYWVNGEGAIPMQNSDAGYANWQPGEPNSNTESWLSVGHANTSGWNAEPNTRDLQGYVVEYSIRPAGATVRVVATDPVAVESATEPSTDTATFEFSRNGDKALDLPVFYSIHGTAINGSDYDEISKSIIIPAGESSARLKIVPRTDPLDVVEPPETVGIRIEPSLILTPSAQYKIDPDRREAAAVIYERRLPVESSIEIAIPRSGTAYKAGEAVEMLATVRSTETVSSVDFYDGDTKIGSADRSENKENLSYFKFTWVGASVGTHNLTAQTTIKDVRIKSGPVQIIVQEVPEVARVSIRFVAPDIIERLDADFAPGYLEVTRTGSTAQNLQIFYSVAGTATAGVDYEALQGYVVIGANRAIARIMVVAKDDLIDEPNETVILTLVPANLTTDVATAGNYIIDPEHNTATVVIYDNDETIRPPVVSISATPAEISEPRQNATSDNTIPERPISSRVTVSRTGSLQFPLRVPLKYEGTATPDVDYENALPEVIISTGSASFEFVIQSRFDSLVEGTETALIRIGVPQADNGGDPAIPFYEISADRPFAKINILDVPPIEPPVISISAAPTQISEPRQDIEPVVATIPERVPTISRVTVTRTGSLQFPLRVPLKYEGTATPDVDYEKALPEVIIPADSASFEFAIQSRRDSLVEGTETALIRIGAPQPENTGVAVIPPYQISADRPWAKIEILDVPIEPPFVSISATPAVISEPGQATIPGTTPDRIPVSSRVTVLRTGNLQFPLRVPLKYDGTAMPDIDYEKALPEVIIPAGSAAFEFVIQSRADSFLEGTETVLIRIGPSPIETAGDPAIRPYQVSPDRPSAKIDILDVPPVEPPLISISATPTEISEPRREIEPATIVDRIATSSRVTVSRTGSLQFALRVPLKYEGTATPDVDYEKALPEVIIPAGSASFEFAINSRRDELVEGTETVLIRIGPSPIENTGDPAILPYQINPDRASAKIDILDVPIEPPFISISATPTEISEPRQNAILDSTIPERPTSSRVTVSRTGSLQFPLRVPLKYDGSATPDIDYEKALPEVVIPAGSAAFEFAIQSRADSLVEGTETILIRIGPSPIENGDAAIRPYQISADRAAAKIDILDVPIIPVIPTVSIWKIVEYTSEPSANTDVGPAVFALRRTGPTDNPLVVFLSYAGTATVGIDYPSPGRTLEFRAGDSEIRVEVFAKDDDLAEDTETVVINLEPAPADSTTARQYRIDPEHRSATLLIYDNDVPAETIVRVEATDPLATEFPPGAEGFDPARFLISRTGNLSRGLEVFFSLHGTALMGEDYQRIPSPVSIPAGQSSVEIQVVPLSPPLVVASPEPADGPMETVALRLEPSPVASPLPSYKIDPENRIAVAVIFERNPPVDGAIEIAFPSAGAIFPREARVEFIAATYHPTIAIASADFFVDGEKVGSSGPNIEDSLRRLRIHRFVWTGAIAGRHVLQAKAALATAASELLSSKIPFLVEGDVPNQPPVVKIVRPDDGAVFIVGDPIEIRAEAKDPDGTVVRMELVVDESVVATSTEDSIHFTWADALAGRHTIVARALDNQGAAGVSLPVRILVRHPDAISFVRRELPETYAPGVAFVVQLRAEPPNGTLAYAVEDRPPAGWQVSDISHNGVFDAITGKVKFGPFTDAEDRTLTYRVTPPADASGRHLFTGQSSLNGALYPITGDESIEPANQYHPADQDQNFAIVLSEVTAYAAAWKAGDSWPTGPVPIPVSYVTRAGLIWRRGEAYRFDGSRPAPECWIPASEPGIAGVKGLRAFAVAVAARAVPGEFQPGVGAQVHITAVPGSSAFCYALEEKPPRGWAISNISDGGIFDDRTGTIRWGLFLDATERTFSYTVTPPSTVAAVGAFVGDLSFDGQLTDIASADTKEDSVVVRGVVPIQITRCQRTGATVTLHISGPSGQTAVIESSPDFANWTELKSIFIPQDAVEFTDTLLEENGHQFYRLRVH